MSCRLTEAYRKEGWPSSQLLMWSTSTIFSPSFRPRATSKNTGRTRRDSSILVGHRGRHWRWYGTNNIASTRWFTNALLLRLCSRVFSRLYGSRICAYPIHSVLKGVLSFSYVYPVPKWDEQHKTALPKEPRASSCHRSAWLSRSLIPVT